MAAKVFLYDAVNDTFYRACDLNGNLISASSICLWDDGVFFGGFDKLYKYDYKTGKIALFRSITSNIKFQITDLYRFDSHTLLAANRWVGALLIDIRTGHTRDVPFDCRDVVTMLPDSKGNFWVTPYCKECNVTIRMVNFFTPTTQAIHQCRVTLCLHWLNMMATSG